MSKTVIPSSSISGPKQPAKNQVYVNSRQGGSAEQSRTKQASMKHANPEFFKRQADKKNDSPLMGTKPAGSFAANVAAYRASLSPQQRGADNRKKNARENERKAEEYKLANEHKGGEYSSRDILKRTTMN